MVAGRACSRCRQQPTSPAAVQRLVEPFLELTQLVVEGGAHVPRFGALRCDAERVGVVPDVLLAAELLDVLDRGDQGLDRGEGVLVGGLDLAETAPAIRPRAV